MRVLLDTHVLLWALTRPTALPDAARDLVADTATRLVVSAASAWEIATKHRIGTLPQASALVQGYEDHLARLGAEELHVSTRHALVAGGLTWEHRDPFDRMLAAQCVLESLPLVTVDPVFEQVPGVRVLR